VVTAPLLEGQVYSGIGKNCVIFLGLSLEEHLSVATPES